MSYDDLLESLEKNIDTLLSDNASLKEQVIELQEINERQRQEMIRSHTEYSQLRDEYNRLRMAHALIGDDTPQKEMVKRQLTRMIQLVDKAIDNLKAIEG